MEAVTEASLITAEQVQKHSTADDCWLVVNEVVWDMTSFASEHPGGAGSEHTKQVRNMSLDADG